MNFQQKNVYVSDEILAERMKEIVHGSADIEARKYTLGMRTLKQNLEWCQLRLLSRSTAVCIRSISGNYLTKRFFTELCCIT